MAYMCCFWKSFWKSCWSTMTLKKQIRSKLRALLKFSSMCANLFSYLSKIDSKYFTDMNYNFCWKALTKFHFRDFTVKKEKLHIPALCQCLYAGANASPYVSVSSHIKPTMTGFQISLLSNYWYLLQTSVYHKVLLSILHNWCWTAWLQRSVEWAGIPFWWTWYQSNTNTLSAQVVLIRSVTQFIKGTSPQIMT